MRFTFTDGLSKPSHLQDNYLTAPFSKSILHLEQEHNDHHLNSLKQNCHTPTPLRRLEDINCNVNSPKASPILTATSSITEADIVPTHTPKARKRVTILEPTTHTFDPFLPTMIASQLVDDQNHQQQIASCNEFKTDNEPINCGKNNLETLAIYHQQQSDKHQKLESNTYTENNNNRVDNCGVMLDRITHDLNFLLNCNQSSSVSTPAGVLEGSSLPSISVSAALPVARILATPAPAATLALQDPAVDSKSCSDNYQFSHH